MRQSSPRHSPTTGKTARTGEITLRGVLVGFVMVFVIVAMTQVISIRHRAGEIAGSAPSPAPTYMLFLYMLIFPPLLGKVSRRLILSRSELILIYAMMLIAGPIIHPFAIGFLVPHMVSPYYFDTHEPRWSVFKPLLPRWYAPTGRETAVGFFHGTGGAVPWEYWAIPLFAWGTLLAALFFLMLCLNVIMRRQWVDNERLTFPLASIPLALAEQERASFIRNSLFWWGLVLPVVFRGMFEMHRLFPWIPAVQLQEVPIINAAAQWPRPWNGLGELTFSFMFWLIGIVYLLPEDLAFSAWFFYGVCLMENVASVWLGASGEAPSVYSNEFPALYAQGAGAAFALTGITLYAARHHLRAVLRKAFRGDPAVDDRSEFLSYRTAVFGAILGTLFIMGWLSLSGMRLWVSVLFFGLMMSYFFVFSRIRAETGLGMGVILWPKMLDEVMLAVVGAKYLALSDITVLYAWRWLYFGPATGGVMASQLESVKLADACGMKGKGIGWAFALVALFTVPLGLAWTVKTYYTGGFVNMPIGQRGTSMVGSQIYWSYQNLIAACDAPTGPDWHGITAIASGGAIAAALSFLRMRFLWFPLHPVGFLAANSWGMHLNWASFLIGWLLKTLITRYGGLKVYRRLLPFFVGMIVGEMLHTGIWGITIWLMGGRE
ncbi:MAG: hypothetical protein IT210_04660 [Armatimonadetes bacterium]|nr:hypothetical protein [Armatimonadota bacterium]